MLISEFNPKFSASLPLTNRILADSNFRVHRDVFWVTVHGSRGPASNFKTDSDLDLCLHVDLIPHNGELDLDNHLRQILTMTILSWHSSIELDLAAVVPLHTLGLALFEACDAGILDNHRDAEGCFLLYKIQKGFDGFVPASAVELTKMYPCMTVWKEQIVWDQVAYRLQKSNAWEGKYDN